MRVRGARPCREGWRFYVLRWRVCVCACSRVNARARVLHLCAQARAGKGQDMSVHWVSGSFSRRDHFTLPHEAFFFHLKRLVAADWALAGSAIGSGRVELFQPTSRPKTTVGRKKRERGGRERASEGAREEETGKKFLFFSFFSSLHRLPLFLPGNMDQGPKSPALRLGRAGRVALTQA